MEDNNPPLKNKIQSFPYLFQSETLSIFFFFFFYSTKDTSNIYSFFQKRVIFKRHKLLQQIYFSEKERKPLSIKALYHGKAPSVPHLDILIASRCVKYLLTARCLRVKTRKFSSALTANFFGSYYTRKK